MMMETQGRELLRQGKVGAARRAFKRDLRHTDEAVQANAAAELALIHLERAREGIQVFAKWHHSRARKYLKTALAAGVRCPIVAISTYAQLEFEARRFFDAARYYAQAALHQTVFITALDELGHLSPEDASRERALLVNFLHLQASSERYAGDLDSSRSTFVRARELLERQPRSQETGQIQTRLLLGQVETLFILRDYRALASLVERDLPTYVALPDHDAELAGRLSKSAESFSQLAEFMGDAGPPAEIRPFLATEYANIEECPDIPCLRRARRNVLVTCPRNRYQSLCESWLCGQVVRSACLGGQA